MDINRDQIDEAILALLFLGRHDGMRTWKSFDWAAMERLHTKGLISDPVGKAKSVVFTDEDLRQSEALWVRTPVTTKSNVVAQKRLAFVLDWSGTAVTPVP